MQSGIAGELNDGEAVGYLLTGDSFGGAPGPIWEPPVVVINICSSCRHREGIAGASTDSSSQVVFCR